MTMVSALGLVSEKTVYDFASIECREFGDILLQAMGISSQCTLFRHDEHYDNFTLGWVLDNGAQCFACFEIGEFMKALKGKTLELCLNVRYSG